MAAKNTWTLITMESSPPGVKVRYCSASTLMKKKRRGAKVIKHTFKKVKWVMNDSWFCWHSQLLSVVLPTDWCKVLLLSPAWCVDQWPVSIICLQTELFSVRLSWRFSCQKRNQNKAMNNDDGEEQNNGRNSTKKLSKEHYIELAAFSDSIYDRGRLGSLFISSNFALEVCVFSVTEGATTCSMFT